MKRFAIIAALALAGCANADRATGWRDTTGAQRQTAALQSDMDACAFDMAKLQSGAQPVQGMGIVGSLVAGPGPQVFNACMTSKGWTQVY